MRPFILWSELIKSNFYQMKEHAGQKNHNLENQLIIDASRTKNSFQQSEQISNVLRQPLDWIYIIQTAGRNCTLPLLSWNLLQNFSHLLSDVVIGELEFNYQFFMKQNMFLAKKLINVSQLFESNNIPLISFKGPLLATRAYGNIALRQFNDLDVLVPPSYLDKAIELLISAGYIPKTDLRWFERKDWYLTRKKDVIFVDENSEYIVELHWKLSGAHFAYPVEIDRLWKNLETSKLAGVDVNVLHFNDLFIYLCLHGARHSWERLSWICDLNELITSRSEIDWKEINQDAKRLGCENILGLGLFLVHKFFGTKVAVPNWEKIESDQTFRELADQIENRLFDENAVNIDLKERYAYHLKLKERRWDKLKLHLHYQFWYLQLLLFPNSLDKETFNLPSWSNPVYYFIRPMRLLYTYIIKPKKN